MYSNFQNDDKFFFLFVPLPIFFHTLFINKKIETKSKTQLARRSTKKRSLCFDVEGKKKEEEEEEKGRNKRRSKIFIYNLKRSDNLKQGTLYRTEKKVAITKFQ